MDLVSEAVGEAINVANMVILSTADDGKTWTAVPPDEVPEILITHESMSVLARGEFCGFDGLYYKGVVIDAES